MTQIIIVYITLAAVAVITIYSIGHTVMEAVKSKKPSRCAGCYLKESCGKQQLMSNKKRPKGCHL